MIVFLIIIRAQGREGRGATLAEGRAPSAAASPPPLGGPVVTAAA